MKSSVKVIIPVLVLVLLSSCASSIDFIADRAFLPNDGIRDITHSVWTERKIGFTTSNNIQLFADVHHPKGEKKTPTILIRIPFTKTLKNKIRADIMGRYWARRGYTVVIQGTRGRYESEGGFYPLIHERSDGIETLKWLEKQSWFNGRLVMWGGSAFGHTQWAVSDQTSPKIDGFFVQIASTNFHGMFYHGNAFSLESAVYWAIRSNGRQDRDVPIDDLQKGVQSLPIISADDNASDDTDFYNDWLLRKNNLDFWEIIDGKDRTTTLQSPILLMAGWFDPFLPTQLRDFENIKSKAKKLVSDNSRLIVGPWGHASSVDLPNASKSIPYRSASLAPSIPWFDYLTGSNNQTSLNMPPVKIFVMGVNKWRDEKEWPLARTKYTSFYLHSNGKANSLNGNGTLNREPPNFSEPTDHYIYNPLNPVPSAGGAMLGTRSGIKLQNEIEERDDVLVYTTPRLIKDIEVTGPIKVILYVSTDAPATDFTAKLVDVHPDGSSYNLSDGILRRKYDDNGLPTRIEIELWPTSNVFLKNHKIRLEISSSNFPRYDRNHNTGDLSPTAIQTKLAHQVIYHSKQYPSHIILPIIDQQ